MIKFKCVLRFYDISFYYNFFVCILIIRFILIYLKYTGLINYVKVEEMYWGYRENNFYIFIKIEVKYVYILLLYLMVEFYCNYCCCKKNREENEFSGDLGENIYI